MPDGVDQREEQSSAGSNFVELNVRVERDVLLDWEFLQFGQKIPRHGEQQQRVTERQGCSRASGDRDANAHDVPQIRVLRHKRIVDEAFNEQSNCDDVKDEQIEDILAILFHKRGVTIPSDEQPVSVRFNARLNVK